MGKIKNLATSWVEAEKILKREGSVTLLTRGGPTWNQEVAERLSRKIGQTVVLIGPHPGEEGCFQFGMNLKSNHQAKVLLNKEDIR